VAGFCSRSDAEPRGQGGRVARRAGGEFPEQPRLADPRSTDQLDCAQAASVELAEDLLERSELVGTPDEVLSKQAIYSSCKPGIDQSRRIERSGCVFRVAPDVGGAALRQARPMARYLLEHRHEPHECGVVFAAFKGHESPLRPRPTLASCRSGGRAIWWTVEGETEADALRLLPYYVAERTTVSRVSEVEIP